MNKKFLIFFVICILTTILINSAPTKISNEVFDELENNSQIRITIELKEPSPEKGFIFTTQKTEDEIEAEKTEIKTDVINQLEKEKVRHIFEDSISIEVSVEDLDELQDNSNIQSIKVPKKVYAFLQNSVPQINASTVWQVQLSETNITGIDETICVLDTGVDFSHPALIGKNKTCVVNCVTESCIPNCSIADDHGHGTHVAGIAAASGEINGVAVGANLIGIKVLDSEGGGNSDDINAAIDWCVDNSETYNISVISMSLGDCSNHTTYCNTDTSASHINNAIANNISVIVAAGNGNGGSCTGITPTMGPSSPACVENATAVGGVYDNDGIIPNFQRGSIFELMAPGASINSTQNEGGYISQDGTSMATPHVAGAFAIIRQFFRLQNNRIPTVSEIKNLLNNTGKLVDDSSGSGYNFTRIDIYSSLVSIDYLKPDVNLISPEDNNLSFSQNITFRCSANDVLLSNITLYLWNSTDLYNTTLAEISGTNVETEFNLTNLPHDEYKWNCLAYDSKNNFSFASSNYSLTIKEINVILNSPEDNTLTNQKEQNFNCSSETSSLKELSNITFYIWNSTELIYNSTQNLTGISNETIFNYNLTNQTTYFWNCNVYDNESNFGMASNNNTLIYETLLPNITLIEPFPSSETSNSASKIFYYNVTDNYNISNCSLIINNQMSLTNSSINLNFINNFTQTFSPGIYNWRINCTDSAKNIGNSSTQSFTITSPAITTSSGGGGGGGGSSVKIYNAPLEKISTGYTRNLRKNDKIKFEITNELTEQHTITTNFVGKDYINLTVRSDPINFVLYLEEEKKLNLSSADYYDFYVKLNSIRNQRANLTIQTIHEQIFKIQEKVDVELEEENKTTTITGNIISKKEENNFQNYFSKIFGIIILIIAVVLLLVIDKRIGKKENEKSKTKHERKQKVSSSRRKKSKKKY